MMTEAKLAHFDNVTKTLISMIRKNTGPDEHNGGISSEDVIILNYFNLYILQTEASQWLQCS